MVVVCILVKKAKKNLFGAAAVIVKERKKKAEGSWWDVATDLYSVYMHLRLALRALAHELITKATSDS